MPGTVFEMAEWYETPSGENLGGSLPDGYEGDAIKLRPLSRLERLRHINPLITEDVASAETDPPELIAKMLELGIVDWTFGAELTPENKAGIDDESLMIAYSNITRMSFRMSGEANGSGTNASTEPNRPKNSRKRSNS